MKKIDRIHTFSWGAMLGRMEDDCGCRVEVSRARIHALFFNFFLVFSVQIIIYECKVKGNGTHPYDMN